MLLSPPRLVSSSATRPERRRSRSRALQLAILVVAAALTSSATAADELGQIPYATLHKAISRAQQVKHPKLRALVRVKSKANPANSDKITMTIQAKGGRIDVPVSSDGEIRNFPISPELLKENPTVLTNQPKGTSELQVQLEALVPDTLTYSYRELAALLDDANVEVKKQAGVLSIMVPRAKALTFQFRDGGKRTLTIQGKQPQVLTTDAEGAIRLEIDKTVAAQDPQVVSSEKPTRVLVN